jgi:hypothetical protein
MCTYPTFWAVLAVFALAPACVSQGDPRVPVAIRVEIDYGPADRVPESSLQLIRKRSTPADVLDLAAETVRGFVCCTKDDVFSINGVEASYEKSLYWEWELNGQPQELAPDRYHLMNGDRVTWVFKETALPEHRR